MPAETHQRSETVGIDAVVDLLAYVVGLEPGRQDAPLGELELDDDLSIVHLWAAVVDEFGERSVGDLDFEGARPFTLRELAELFTRQLGNTTDVRSSS